MADVVAGTFDHDGLSFHYLAAGAGAPIVLLHGGGSRASNFRDVLARLGDSHRAIAYDMRGFGDTGAKPRAPITHALWAADVAACLDHFGFDRVNLVGWSLGAAIALNFAANYNTRVRAMCLLGAPHPERKINRALFQRRLDIIAAGGTAADVVAATFDSIGSALSPWVLTHRPAALAQVRAEHLSHDVKLAAAVIDGYASRPDLAAALPRIQCPVTLLVGDADRTCDLAGAQELERHLACANIEIVPNCGHYYAVEQPDTVAAMIAASFARGQDRE